MYFLLCLVFREFNPIERKERYPSRGEKKKERKRKKEKEKIKSLLKNGITIPRSSPCKQRQQIDNRQGYVQTHGFQEFTLIQVLKEKSSRRH